MDPDGFITGPFHLLISGALLVYRTPNVLFLNLRKLGLRVSSTTLAQEHLCLLPIKLTSTHDNGERQVKRFTVLSCKGYLIDISLLYNLELSTNIEYRQGFNHKIIF